MKALITIIFLISLAGCAGGNLTSHTIDSSMKSSNLQLRCVSFESGSENARDLTSRYDGWKMVYISENKPFYSLKTTMNICFQREILHNNAI